MSSFISLLPLLSPHAQFPNFRQNESAALKWYKSLDENQRINLKEVYHLTVGESWSNVGVLFSYRERITLLYDKLKEYHII